MISIWTSLGYDIVSDDPQADKTVSSQSSLISGQKIFLDSKSESDEILAMLSRTGSSLSGKERSRKFSIRKRVEKSRVEFLSG